MLAHGVSGLSVIGDDSRLVGIITEGDLLRRVELGAGVILASSQPAAPAQERAGAHVKSNGRKVADVITTSVVTIDEELLSAASSRSWAPGIKGPPVKRGEESMASSDGLISAHLARGEAGRNFH